MPEGFPITTNFTSGEVSPSISGRTDFKGYANGVEKLENFIVLPQGGALRRSGTRFLAEVKDSSKLTRVKRFEFSRTDSFILEIGEYYIRFFKNGAPVLSGGFGSSPVEVVTPYTEAQLSELNFAQSADVLYLSTLEHQTRKLSRISDTNWTFALMSTDDGPYLDTDTSDTTMWLETITDRGNINSTAADFVSGDVGKFVEFYYQGYLILGEVTAYVDVNNVTIQPKLNVINPDSIDSNAVLSYAAAGGSLANRIRSTVGIWGLTTQYSYLKVGATWYYLGVNIEQPEELPEVVGPPKTPAYSVDVITVASTPTKVATTGHLTLSGRLITAVLKSSTAVFDNSTDVGRHIRLNIRNNQIPCKVSAYTSATQVSVTLSTVVPHEPNNPTAYIGNAETVSWRLGAWYTGNWPRSLTFHEGRLCFMGTNKQPQTIWMSRSQDFENHAPTELDSTVVDDNAINRTLNSSKVNQLLWGVTGPVLLLGSFGAEWQVKPTSINEAVTPKDFNAKEQTAWGSENVTPERIGTGVVYLQNGGTILRELVYSYEIDSHIANPLNTVSEHILREAQGGIDIAYQKTPSSRIWIATSSGKLVCLTYEKDQQVLAWSNHIIGGTDAKVESIESIPDSVSSTDKLYTVVSRTVNGGTKRYIECMEEDFWPDGAQDKNSMYFMDSFVTNNTPSGPYGYVVSGLGHLEGETVKVIVNGSVRPDAVVTGGSITLDRVRSQYVTVGLKYKSLIKTLPLEAGSYNGTAQGKTKRIHSLIFRLINSLGLKVGATEETSRVISFRETSGAMDSSAPLLTGDKEISLDSGYDLRSQFVVTSEEPYPLHIAAIMPQVVTNK